MVINLPFSTKDWDRKAKDKLEKAIKISARQLYEQIMADPEKYGFCEEQVK